jgi:hypothetical protein
MYCLAGLPDGEREREGKYIVPPFSSMPLLLTRCRRCIGLQIGHKSYNNFGKGEKNPISHDYQKAHVQLYHTTKGTTQHPKTKRRAGSM